MARRPSRQAEDPCGLRVVLAEPRDARVRPPTRQPDHLPPLQELREQDAKGLNQSVEANGLSYGLQLGYRIDITDYLFAGVDLQYALNGVQGSGNDDINLAGIRVDDYMLGNLELGFKF